MITTIIFDFAGVLTTKRLFPSLAEILGKKFNIDKKIIEKRLYDNEINYILGNESTYSFWKRAFRGLDVPFKDFKSAFLSWYELNQELMRLIKNFKKKYSIIMISDNFDASTPSVRKNKKLDGLFDKMYFSNEMHLSKKDRKIFEKVIEYIETKPEECLFIDDKEENLIYARKAGMHTILFTNTDKLKKDFAKIGVLTD